MSTQFEIIQQPTTMFSRSQKTESTPNVTQSMYKSASSLHPNILPGKRMGFQTNAMVVPIVNVLFRMTQEQGTSGNNIHRTTAEHSTVGNTVYDSRWK
mmetsp:Transcript_7542/g.8782  ORF Transcript_7542/g.8782 Transcript_7542/m.8782 type:complete len:98 (-) Transcript_7542:164-457(-)